MDTPSVISNVTRLVRNVIRAAAGVILLTGIPVIATATPQPAVAPYLQPGAPVFSETIPHFRERFNRENPDLPLPEYRTVNTGQPAGVVVLAASQITPDFYSSTALEPGSGKIKSLQMTWLPHKSPAEKASRDLAFRYMNALIRYFTPLLSREESEQKLGKLLKAAKDSESYVDAEGPLRYVVSVKSDKGITLAIEPVRLVLPGS